MKTVLKWPGGKEKELPVIRKYTPSYTGRFIEPFVGGGAVFFDTSARHCCINDKSKELINLYNCIKTRNADLKHYLHQEICDFSLLGDFVDHHSSVILDLYHGKISVDTFIHTYADFFSGFGDKYNAIFLQELKKNLSSKIKRSSKLELENGGIPDSDRLDNIEASLKSSYYMFIRYLLNHPSSLSHGHNAAVFFFIREYCYSSMFRYNAKGEFNVPYGGISYNRKDFTRKVNYLLSDEVAEKLANADIYCEDFEIFLSHLQVTKEDFLFLDPPYDSEFSTYSQNKFDRYDQERLWRFLTHTKAMFLLIIKNTDFIYNLYKDKFYIDSFDKKYLVSFMNRNDQKAEHLIITNYKCI